MICQSVRAAGVRTTIADAIYGVQLPWSLARAGTNRCAGTGLDLSGRELAPMPNEAVVSHLAVTSMASVAMPVTRRLVRFMRAPAYNQLVIARAAELNGGHVHNGVSRKKEKTTWAFSQRS